MSTWNPPRKFICSSWYDSCACCKRAFDNESGMSEAGMVCQVPDCPHQGEYIGFGCARAVDKDGGYICRCCINAGRYDPSALLTYLPREQDARVDAEAPYLDWFDPVMNRHLGVTPCTVDENGNIQDAIDPNNDSVNVDELPCY